ncbi:MAG TPA: PLP-dependent aminotransferase family protein [Bryobacteraceae bacterium]|nr:PLP-dependent aminotransferase family protein [Bryobacteraceae bacterium]
MWRPDIERRSGPTAHRIVEALAEAVNAGSLAAGAQLPPHRELADTLGLSVGTVSRAYSLARERGLITGTVGRGTFVAARLDAPDDAAGELDLTQNFIRWDPGGAVAQLLRTAFRDHTDLRTLMEIYPNAAGRPEHRQAAARWLGHRGLAADAEQVVLTNGAQHGIFTALMALTRPGDLIATEHLTYPGVKNVAIQLQLRLAGLPIDHEGLLPEAFERLCATAPVRILYIIPTLHNPTGALMSEDRRETIADIARRRNVTILEDDIYSFLVDGGPPPIAAFAPERSYVVTGLSKSVFPGLRLGFVVCPTGGAARVAEMVRTSLLTVSPLTAAVGTSWMEDGTVDRIIDWKRTEIRWRWEMAWRYLGLDLHDYHFAAHLWLPLPGGIQPEELVASVRARGVILAPAAGFAVEPQPAPRAVRICLGVPSTRARLQQALAVVREVMEGRTPATQLI